MAWYEFITMTNLGIYYFCRSFGPVVQWIERKFPKL